MLPKSWSITRSSILHLYSHVGHYSKNHTTLPQKNHSPSDLSRVILITSDRRVCLMTVICFTPKSSHRPRIFWSRACSKQSFFTRSTWRWWFFWIRQGDSAKKWQDRVDVVVLSLLHNSISYDWNMVVGRMVKDAKRIKNRSRFGLRSPPNPLAISTYINQLAWKYGLNSTWCGQDLWILLGSRFYHFLAWYGLDYVWASIQPGFRFPQGFGPMFRWTLGEPTGQVVL